MGGHETEFRLYTHTYRGTCEQEVCSIRENRSKLFFSSGFLFTWQVSRLSLAGGLFGCKTTRGGETSALTEPHSDIKHSVLQRKDPETVTESVLLYTITWTTVGSQLGSAHRARTCKDFMLHNSKPSLILQNICTYHLKF